MTDWSKELFRRKKVAEASSELAMMQDQARSDGLDFRAEETYPGCGTYRAYLYGSDGKGDIYGKSRREVVMAIIARERAKGYLAPPASNS